MKSKYCIKTKMLPFCMALLLSVFTWQSGFAQEQSKFVSGNVTSADDNMGVPGATVLVQGSKTSTVTDFDGLYKIEAKAGDVLVISFMGYKTQKVTVGTQRKINVTLQGETAELKEIVVIGYGTQKKKVNTAATSLVSGKDIQQVASLDVVNALQGQASGVNVTSSSGQPGANMVVNIRGAGTAGKSDPLYVVDGVVVDNGIGYLDPSAIERIDVLKDASAASIYGARAANGVILVTTKKGKDGKMNIALNSYTGFQQVAKRLDLLNTREYTTIMNEARVNSGLTPLYSQAQINGASTDWQDHLFNDGAIKQNHSLLITGGDKKSTIATGLSYYGQDGMIGSATNQSSYDRITFSLNSTSQVIENYLKIGENFTYSNTKSSGIADEGIYSNGIRSFINAAPIDTPYAADGSFARSNISADVSNPVGSLYYNNFNQTKNNRLVGNLFAELKILKDLTFRTSFGVDMTDSNYRSFRPVYSLSSSDNNVVSSVTQSGTKSLGWIFENTLQYKFVLAGSHNFDVLAGTSAKKNTADYMEGQGRNLIFDDFAHAYLDNSKDPTSNVVKGNRTDYAIQSYFGRLLYDYDNKYLLSATVRRDGSSEFGPNNKYAIFPSFSAGWNLDRETFFKENAVLNTFKLRASWGQNGNDQFSRRFAYMSVVNSTNKGYHFGTGDETILVGSSPDQLADPNLKWETSEQLDLGFDATLFTNFTLTFDYYDKKTKDWLVLASIPTYAGASAPYINGGDVSNKGYEIALGYRKSFGGWNFGINANISHNENKVLRIANNEGIIHGESNLLFQGLDEMNRVEVGKPMGYFWGLQTNGIFQNAAEVAAGVQPNASPGDVRFVDLNGDGKIDANDKTEVGNPNPDYTYGVNFDLSYKAFDLSVNTYGTAGGQNVFGVHDYTRAYSNHTTEVLNRWTSEGTSNTTPRVTYGTDPNGNYTKFSDLYVQDSDFFRIKNVTIGCDLVKLSDKLNFFSKFRLYVAANNLYTFTKYKGMDPEIGFGNVNVGQEWARGIDVGYYPQPRSYMMGLNVNF
ncbi:SusC/RagA family TonB-linked outer membrane protein [Flavobacterium sp. IR1]|nr:SusC/RagA family TonB-linked outer membrane protein [Flavobacterium sp. IR1]